MDPQTSPQNFNLQNQIQTGSTPTPTPLPTRSKTVCFLPILLLVLALVVWGFFSEKKITGLDVATRTTNFLDKTLQADGGMLGGMVCAKDSTVCEPMQVNENQPHLGQAIYGYYTLAQATGDSSHRVKADDAMNYILDECQGNVEMCAWNFFPLSRYYFDTKDDRYLQAMLRPAFLTMSSKDIVGQNAGHKLASLYKATGDENYRAKLVAVAEEELLNWPRSVNEYEYSIQVVWSVLLPAYTATQDAKYLRASEQFFDSFDLAERFSKLRAIEVAIKGADALLSLSEVSDRGEVYWGQAHAVLQEVLENLWDDPETPIINGDYGFLDITEDKAVLKKTLNNGWLIKLFVIMKDEKFTLSNDK